MKKIIKIILGNIILLICKIFSKIFDFQFCHLFTSRIGHQTINFDIALLSVKKNTFILCSHDKKIANNFILSFFKKQKNVFFSQIFQYCHRLISCVDENSKFIISWPQYQPKFSFHLQSNSKINFPFYSKEKINNILSKYNLKKNFVGLFSRNSLYVAKNKLPDKNFHDYRDFDFEDFKLAIEYLKKDNSIVKLGATYFEEKNFEFSKTKIFTSMDFNSNEEVDYLLNTYSRYNVMGDSGITTISSISRKKIVYVNLIPLNLDHLSYCSPGSIILPKKIFDMKKSRFLTFSENLKINFDIHHEADPYKKNNLKVVNNSPEDILKVIIEMEEKIKGKNIEEEGKLNDLFWKNITGDNHVKINYLKNILKLSISTNFLKKNQDLF